MHNPRHIVLLVADSLRYDAVFGGHEHLLPYAVGHGINFAQARSAGCWTLPATATLFTGLLPHAHGATSQSRGIRPQVPTLAERMSALDYAPSMVSANIATTEIFGLHRGFERVECAWKRIPARFKRLHALLVLAGKPRLRRKLLSLDMIAGKLSDDLDAAKVWLQSTLEVVFDRARSILREAQQQNRRTFCFLNLMETHFPYHIADAFETSMPTLWGQLRELYSLFHFVNQTRLIRDKDYIAPDMLLHLRQRQRQAWVFIAARVDAFTQELRERYDALVVFASDHGDNFGEQGWQYHFSNVTDAGTRVPLLWLPHDHDDARTVETPISTRDLFGTLLKAAGDKEEAFFFLTVSPERSVPIMQSFWYDNRGRTQPRYRYNQFAFVAGTQRFVHRHGQWRAAPLTRRGDPEVAFQDLGRRVDPLREAVDRPERLAYIRGMFEAYQAFAAGV